MPVERKWFARRFPVGHPRNAMAPVSRAGFLVAFGFAGAMLLGALGFMAFALASLFFAGVAFFVLTTALAAGFFIWLSQAKGDRTKTVADYRNENAEG